MVYVYLTHFNIGLKCDWLISDNHCDCEAAVPLQRLLHWLIKVPRKLFLTHSIILKRP
jgi:hypothetical protein